MANGDAPTRPPGDDDLPTQAWPFDDAREDAAPREEGRAVVIGREESRARGVEFQGISRYSSGPPPPRHERAASVGRIAGFVVAAIVLVGAPWLLLTRGPGEDVLRPKSPPPSAVRTMPTRTPSPTPTLEPGRYVVTSKGNCVRVRKEPSLDGEILDCLQNGIEVTSDGKTATADGYDWLHVRDPIARVWGWAAAELLKRA